MSAPLSKGGNDVRLKNSDRRHGLTAYVAINGLDVVDDGARPCRRMDENPFSFKRFLQPSGSHRPSSSGGSASIATLDLANDLPDFVQDHYHSDRERGARPRGGRSQATTDAPLPDFALDTDLGSRFHAGDLHSFGAAATVGGWVPGDADSISSHSITSHYNESSDHRHHSPVDTSGTARFSQFSDFNIDPDTEDSEQLDGFNLLDGRNTASHHEHCISTPTDGPLTVAANSAGGLPDFLSDSAAHGVVDICSRNITAAASASSTVQLTRPLTNGYASPDLESESVLSQVKFFSVCVFAGLTELIKQLCSNSVSFLCYIVKGYCHCLGISTKLTETHSQNFEDVTDDVNVGYSEISSQFCG